MNDILRKYAGSLLLAIFLVTSFNSIADDNTRKFDELDEAHLIDLDQLKTNIEFEKRKTSNNELMASSTLFDFVEPCNPFPIPTESQGPVVTRNYARFGDNFRLVAWRYPCDEDLSYVIFTIEPQSGDVPFICSSQITLIQSGFQNDDYKITQDPVGNDNSHCGEVVVDSSFALKAWSFASPNIDLQLAFDVYWDFGDNSQQFTMFAYDPSDYDIGGEPPPAELSNDVGVNGLFFDPGNPGHGFDIIRHDDGLVVYYYGHSASGERLWLISDNYQGDLEYNEEFRIDMYEIAEGTFGSPVLPSSIWGSIFMEFYDCDSGQATLNGDDGILEIDFVRLVGIPNIGCE